jgi:signal transduction histidine kinase/ActR/RegA family two-component response regulator
MFGILGGLFDPDGFMPRWTCGDWSAALGWLHIGSDLAIWSAYTAIPVVIGYYALRRKDVPFVPLFWLFGAFIFACGTGHLIEAVIFWTPVYRLSGVVKLITAVVSWGTVIALIKVVPDAMRLPGLARLNTALESEIGERKRAQQEREHLLESERAARTDAERANRVKDDFLSIVSHELRTPLNAIQGYAHLLLVETPDPAFVHEAAEVIERNSRAQAQIIDDLLDTSRIMSGKVRLDMHAVDLAAVVDAAISSSRPAANVRDLRIETALDLQAGRVLGDATRLQQVVWNLLSNAIKFTPKGGHVKVALARRGAQAELTVSDSGEGIEAEFLPHVFDRFLQADSGASRRHAGLGLGLSIVRQLVELHGGQVTAASAGRGQGATFTVSLPVMAVSDEAIAAERRHASGASAAAGFELPTLAGLKVLVVDDEPDARKLVERLLSDHDVEVVLAGSVAEAEETFERERPDLVLSDIGMPEHDGYELIHRIRARPAAAGGQTPAAALTAFARSDDRTRALLAGYQAHITKPVHAQELIAVVAALAGRTGR